MLVLKRHYEFWFSILALHRLGAIVIPGTHMLTTKDVVYRNNAAGIKAIVCAHDSGAAGSIDESLPHSQTLKVRVMVGETREGWVDFHVTQHRKGHRNNCVVAVRFKAAGTRLIMDDDFIRSLIDGDHLCAISDS